MTAPAFTPEQRAAVEDRSGSRLLAANAGSGKTAVMVERFVEAVLRDEVPVGSILALTFTEKAAGELRDRVRRRFGELGEDEHARSAEGAWIGTIHGFCARLLRIHPLAAGLDPRFAVLDEPAATRIARVAWERALEGWAAAEGDAAVDLLAAYGPGLREAILSIHAELRSRGQRRPTLPPVAPAAAPEPVDLAGARDAAAAFLAGASGGVRVDAARSALEACRSVLDIGTVPLPGALDPAKMSNGAKVLGEDPPVAYRNAWQAYRKACADHHARAAVPLLDALLGRFSDAYAEAKAARAALDFEDLQLAVRDLLRSDEGLRRRWRDRFALLMVDEFQDTNRLQLDVLETLERDNLFVVGDEHQSIYGFRHADVEIFRARRTALGAERTSRLRTNFRSRRELLDVVNAAFTPIFGDAFEPLVAGRDDAPEAPLDRLFDPDRLTVGSAPAGPAVEVQLVDLCGFADRDAASLAEAGAVAARLRREVDGGRRAGEIVVLVRATASLRPLEQALEDEGLPTYVVGGRGYWSQEQVRDGLAWLSALANPLDETALHTVLASPFVGAGSDALILVAQAGREAGGAWAALCAGGEWMDALPEADRRRLEDFTALFAGERARAERLGAEVLLDRAAASTGYDLAVLARPGGERRLANLRKLMRLAREYERSEGRDLRGFISYAVEQDVGAAREGEAALESEGLDAIRLMTIHRAKGLEFPVVCVADLGRQGPTNRPRILVGDDGTRIGLRLVSLGAPKSVPALDYDELAAEADAAEAEEERRLLYVAMTRAEERLILSGAIDTAKLPEPRPSGPPIDWVARAVLGDPAAVVAALSVDHEVVVDRDFDGRPAPVHARLVTAERMPAAPEPRRAASAGTALPEPPAVEHGVPAPGQQQLPAVRRLSYSSLAEYARCPYRFYLQRHLGLRDVPAPGEGGPGAQTAGGLDARMRGTIVHELLERHDMLSAAAPSAPEIEAAAEVHGVELTGDELADITALLEAFGGSELRERLARARLVRREAPFVLALEPGPEAPLLHGVVDVMASEQNGGVLVVDYKTDRLEGADPEAIVASSYAVQRMVYALAALRAGAPSVEVAHLFLERPDEPAVVRYEAADSGALAAAVLALATGALGGHHPVAEDPNRGLCGTCPGRRTLCAHPEPLTLRDPETAGHGV